MPLLNTIFIQPEQALALTLPEWSLLIHQARRANVLARLGYIFLAEGLSEKIPTQAWAHIQSSLTFANRFSCSLQWEIECIAAALKSLDIPLIFLKGAGYFIADNAAAKGRIFSDVDILVPESRLLEVEIALIQAGWITSNLDPYDQTYYRQWMHEIPPMRHLKRQTSIDVHHNILPKTCQASPNAQDLLANCVNIPDTDFWVLAPEDRILHSATHLFHGGEFEQGFRDLSDLNLLLKEFSHEPEFWESLMQRAYCLKQTMALRFALRYCHKIFHTPIPLSILAQTKASGTSGVSLVIFDALFLSVLQPNHKSCTTTWTHCARFALFLRSHYLKMPIYLLIPHLLRKSLKPLEAYFTKS